MQYNLIYNRAGSLLDLVFSNIFNVNIISEINSLIPLDYMYHPALKITLPVMSEHYLPYNEVVYDFLNCDYNDIRSSLASIDWNGALKNLNINKAVDIFYEILFDIINSFCHKTCLHTPKHPIWFSKNLKQLIFSKKISSHKIYKQTPNELNYNRFSNLRAQCKTLSKTDYASFLYRTQNSIANNPKSFWNYIKSKRLNSSIPMEISYDNQNFIGGDKVINCFASYFSSTYHKSNIVKNVSINCVSPCDDLNSCTLSLSDIYNELSCITNKTSPGPDNISSIFFTECKFVLAIPLLLLFNSSLITGVLPDK